MLARLDRIDGVERSFANRTGTLIRLAVKPETDVEWVAEEAARILSAGVADQMPTRLADAEVNAALQAQEWRDASRIDELSAIEERTLLLRALAALALAGVTIGAGIFWWWRTRRARLRRPA